MGSISEIAIPVLYVALFFMAGLSIIAGAKREQRRAERERKHRELIKRIKEEKMRIAAEEKEKRENDNG